MRPTYMVSLSQVDIQRPEHKSYFYARRAIYGIVSDVWYPWSTLVDSLRAENTVFDVCCRCLLRGKTMGKERVVEEHERRLLAESPWYLRGRRCAEIITQDEHRRKSIDRKSIEHVIQKPSACVTPSLRSCSPPSCLWRHPWSAHSLIFVLWHGHANHMFFCRLLVSSLPLDFHVPVTMTLQHPVLEPSNHHTSSYATHSLSSTVVLVYIEVAQCGKVRSKRLKSVLMSTWQIIPISHYRPSRKGSWGAAIWNLQ